MEAIRYETARYGCPKCGADLEIGGLMLSGEFMRCSGRCTRVGDVNIYEEDIYMVEKIPSKFVRVRCHE